MVRPRRAYKNPVWSAVYITEILVACFIAGVLLSILIWG
jgi:hypothetical protein